MLNIKPKYDNFFCLKNLDRACVFIPSAKEKQPLHDDFYERQRLVGCESLTVRAPRTTDPTRRSSQHYNEYGQKNKQLQPNERIIKVCKA